MSFLLQQVLLDPHRTLQLNNEKLHQLLSEGRSSRLLASLAFELQSAGLTDKIPPTVLRHLQSAQIVHEKQKRDLAYECEKIQSVLHSVGERLVLLKGAAYLLADIPASRGRLITDIDILVPHRSINTAEHALVSAGWMRSNVSQYDDNYYRKWGHEIPALTHPKRETTLDVHHNILPPTSGPNVDANLLFGRLIEIKPGIFTLSWHDMVIHSATHLFHEGEFHHGLRDLWDLDRMLRDFPKLDHEFWEGLVSRARELQLLDPLYHGLVYAEHVFGTPVPAHVKAEATSLPRRLRKPLMDFLFVRAFRPNQPQSALPFTALALTLLYVRSHYLRMPLYLLLPHLARKAWLRRINHDAGLPDAKDRQDA